MASAKQRINGEWPVRIYKAPDKDSPPDEDAVRQIVQDALLWAERTTRKPKK